MAIMIPDIPIDVQPGSREDEMFYALSNLPDEYYVFHSFVLITNVAGMLHESETDFVVFHPQKGIVCIEAKAGQVRCVGGKWYYGSGIEMSRGGPYRQADLNKWKLEKYFTQNGLSDLWNKCKVLHAVWFPSIDRAYLNSIHFTSDADRSITLTKESLTSIEPDIERLFAIQLPSGVEMDLTKNEAQKILSNVLCPSFDLVPSVASEMSIKRNAFNRLLKEQANVLNFLEEQPYAIINGVAGTGKTMIALEKARRHAENNERVLFLCYNRLLCDFLRENYAHEQISYYTIDALACSLCRTSSADYELLEQKLELLYYEGEFPYKHIVIDEGQDFGQDQIEETRIIDTLETIVLSNEISGTFYLFYDKNQLVQGRQIPKYITEADCKLTLYRNCRNTENIAITSMRPLGKDKVPKMFKGAVAGDPPRIHISDDIESQIQYLDNTLHKLIGDKVKDVVILTCTTVEKSWLYPHLQNGKYKKFGQDILFTTCRKFKGLEADAIILIDVVADTFDSYNKLMFYVGTSRARFNLSVICNMSEEDCEYAIAQLDVQSVKKPKKTLAAALNALLA